MSNTAALSEDTVKEESRNRKAAHRKATGSSVGIQKNRLVGEGIICHYNRSLNSGHVSQAQKQSDKLASNNSEFSSAKSASKQG